MIDDARGRAARPRPDAPLRRRDLRDGVGAHGGTRPGHRRARRPLLERADGRRARRRTTPSSCSTGCCPAPTTPTRCASTTSRSGRAPGCRRAASARCDPDRLPHFAFGTCRTTGSHDAQGNRAHGVDALRTLALALRDDPEVPWPDVLLLLGDQVYADTTPHEELEEFMAARRDLDEPPGHEIKDFVEYAELYRLAWSEDVIRWVLSTVPSAMIFDDHDIRDDWNTSWSWRREMRATTWWQERIVAGLGVVLGAPAPGQPLAGRAGARRRSGAGSSSTRPRAHRRARPHRATSTRSPPGPTPSRSTYRWSYTRALGDCAPASSSTPGRRASCDPTAARCSTPTRCAGSTSVLQRRRAAPVHRHLAALPAAARACTTSRRWTRRWPRAPTGARWPGPPRSCAAASTSSTGRPSTRASTSSSSWSWRWPAASAGRRRRRSPSSPATSTTPTSPRSTDPLRLGAQSRVVQAVCSPIRNPMPRAVRVVMSLFARSLVRPMRFVASPLAAGARARPTRGRSPTGPWFDNNIALVTVRPEAPRRSTWVTGVVEDDAGHPRLQQVYAARLDPLPATVRVGSGSVQG